MFLSLDFNGIVLVLLPTLRSGPGRLILCVVSSLLVHWFAFSFSRDENGQPTANTSTNSRIEVVFSEHGKRVKKPTVPDARSPHSAPPPEFSSAPVTRPTQADPPEELYAAPNDVDEMAFALEIPELPLPADDRISSGMLRIRILINQNGKPDGIEVLETSFPDEYVASLVEAFRKGAFRPAILDGKPVNSWRIIDATFGEMEAENNQPAKLGN